MDCDDWMLKVFYHVALFTLLKSLKFLQNLFVCYRKIKGSYTYMVKSRLTLYLDAPFRYTLELYGANNTIIFRVSKP